MADDKRYATEIYNRRDGKTYTVRDPEAYESITQLRAELGAGLAGKADAGTVYNKAETDTKLAGYVPIATYNQLLARVAQLESIVEAIQSGQIHIEPQPGGDDDIEVTLTDDSGNTIVASFVDENDQVYQIRFEDVTETII